MQGSSNNPEKPENFSKPHYMPTLVDFQIGAKNFLKITEILVEEAHIAKFRLQTTLRKIPGYGRIQK